MTWSFVFFTRLGALWCARDPGEEQRHLQRRHLVYSQGQQVGNFSLSSASLNKHLYDSDTDLTPPPVSAGSTSSTTSSSASAAGTETRPWRWARPDASPPSALSSGWGWSFCGLNITRSSTVVWSCHHTDNQLLVLPCAAAYDDHLTRNTGLVMLSWWMWAWGHRGIEIMERQSGEENAFCYGWWDGWNMWGGGGLA